MFFQKEEFERKADALTDEMPTRAVTQYLKDNWCNSKWSCKWCYFGRRFFHEDHDTNNLVER